MIIKQIEPYEVIGALATGQKVVRFVEYKNGKVHIEDLGDSTIANIQSKLKSEHDQAYFVVKRGVSDDRN